MRAVIAATAGFAFGGPIGAVAAGVAAIALNPVVIVATGYALGGPIGAVAAAAAAEPQAAVNAATTAAGAVANGVSNLSTVFFDPSNNNDSESDEERNHDPKDKTKKQKID
jgi:hypothetical protein